jgi:hypothetical protein
MSRRPAREVSSRIPIPLAFAVVNAFHVCGIIFAAWALLVSFLGITRENFPGSAGAARLVGAISILLAAAAIGSGIYTSAHEDEEGGGGEGAAVLLSV